MLVLAMQFSRGACVVGREAWATGRRCALPPSTELSSRLPTGALIAEKSEC